MWRLEGRPGPTGWAMDGLEGGILSNFIQFHLIIAIYNSIMSSHALIASAIAAIVTGTSKLLDSNPSSIVFFQSIRTVLALSGGNPGPLGSRLIVILSYTFEMLASFALFAMLASLATHSLSLVGSLSGPRRAGERFWVPNQRSPDQCYYWWRSGSVHARRRDGGRRRSG